MQFFTPEWRAKRCAKRLKKSLKRHGYDLADTTCLNLTARLYGFAHFSAFRNASWDAPLSPFDDEVDEQTLEARFEYQECIMAEAGFAEIAGLALDEANPTGRGDNPSVEGAVDGLGDDASLASPAEPTDPGRCPMMSKKV